MTRKWIFDNYEWRLHVFIKNIRFSLGFQYEIIISGHRNLDVPTAADVFFFLLRKISVFRRANVRGITLWRDRLLNNVFNESTFSENTYNFIDKTSANTVRRDVGTWHYFLVFTTNLYNIFFARIINVHLATDGVTISIYIFIINNNYYCDNFGRIRVRIMTYFAVRTYINVSSAFRTCIDLTYS